MQLDGGGGLPARPEKEAWGLLLEASFYFLPLSFYVAFYYLLFFYYPCTFLHLLGAGLVEESGHSLRRGPEVRDQSPVPGVLWVRKDGGGSGRIRGERFLWASEGSNVTFLHILSPTSPQESLPHTICHHLQSTPSGVPRNESFWSCQTGTGINLCNCSSSSRGRDTGQYATPLYSVGGH